MKRASYVLFLSLFCLSACGQYDAGQQASALSVKGNAPAYLALGDSFPFGKDPNHVDPNNDNLFVGYPELLGVMLDKPVINAGCPGETSDSILSSTVPDNGCRAYRAAYDLHVDYDGPQADFAADYLANHPKVFLVTLTIGGNDPQMLMQQCNGDMNCFKAGLPGMVAKMAQNYGTVLGKIRAVYDGQIIVNTYGTRSPTASDTSINKTCTKGITPTVLAYGGEIAPVPAAFMAAEVPYNGDGCAAGLFVKLPDGTCDKHYSELGAQLAADTIFAMVQ